MNGFEGRRQASVTRTEGQRAQETHEDHVVSITPIDALNAMHMARQYLASTGAVDSEYEQIENWCTEVKKGVLSPMRALEKVQALTDARQNYH